MGVPWGSKNHDSGGFVEDEHVLPAERVTAPVEAGRPASGVAAAEGMVGLLAGSPPPPFAERSEPRKRRSMSSCRPQ